MRSRNEDDGNGSGVSPLQRARIVVVDDETAAARLLVRMLERQGFDHVEVFADPRDALVYLADHRPEVVVLDVHMPHIDGFGMLAEMRTISGGLDAGVIAISGDPSVDIRRAMLAAGADDFITRPCDPRELALRVGHLAATIRCHRDLIAQNASLEREVLALLDPDT